jgi:hypothetical protein
MGSAAERQFFAKLSGFREIIREAAIPLPASRFRFAPIQGAQAL